jgi:hypothetical protein
MKILGMKILGMKRILNDGNVVLREGRGQGHSARI